MVGDNQVNEPVADDNQVNERVADDNQVNEPVADDTQVSGQVADDTQVSGQVVDDNKAIEPKKLNKLAPSVCIKVCEISPYPSTSSTKPRKRKADTARVLTSTPHKKDDREADTI